MTEEIFDLAVALGSVAERDRTALRTFCQSARGELLGRLKDGVGAEDCAPAFVLGAAWLALGDLCVGDCTLGVERFTAGGLTIQQGDKLTPMERCAALRQRAEVVLAPYLRDQGFSFVGVRG